MRDSDCYCRVAVPKSGRLASECLFSPSDFWNYPNTSCPQLWCHLDDFLDQSCVPMLDLTNVIDGTWDLRLQAWIPAVRTISATFRMCNG